MLQKQSPLQGPKSSSSGLTHARHHGQQCTLQQLLGGCCELGCSSSHGRSLALAKPRMQRYSSSWVQLKCCSAERPEEGIPQIPHRGQVLWGCACGIGRSPPEALGLITITTSFSDAEMLNWQERDCETHHPNPKARDSIGCSMGFPETPHG